MSNDTTRALIERFWATLYERDFDGVGAFFAADGEYTDMPTPPEDVARGPDQIAARLRLGLEPLASISHTVKTIVVEGDTAVTEHVEHWEWPTGETMALPVASVHELRDGTITRWCDYWDMNVLTTAAPTWWFEDVLQGWK